MDLWSKLLNLYHLPLQLLKTKVAKNSRWLDQLNAKEFEEQTEGNIYLISLDLLLEMLIFNRKIIKQGLWDEN